MSNLLSGAEIVFKVLEERNVDSIFGYPGGAVLPIYDELKNHKTIRHFLVRHEQGAVHAADGYARMLAKEGKMGVFCSQGGPGIENSFGGFAQAWAEAVPVLYLPAGSPANVAEVTVAE